MANDMYDLRREVASRLRNSIHGKEIDMLDGPTPRMSHMLGITPLSEEHDPKYEERTLMDPQHHFWAEYEEEIRTKNQALRKLQTAIRSLREDDTFRMLYPYGEEADIVYCEVDELDSDKIETNCPECDALLKTEPTLDLSTHSGFLKFSLDCDECEYGSVMETAIGRR